MCFFRQVLSNNCSLFLSLFYFVLYIVCISSVSVLLVSVNHFEKLPLKVLYKLKFNNIISISDFLVHVYVHLKTK